MINGHVSPDGALFVLQQDAPDGALTVGGQAMDNLGVLYVGNVGPMGSVALDPMTLFANGEAGDFWDDTDRASMFADLAMTTPAVIEGKVAAQVGRANGIVASSAPGQEPTLSARYNWLVSSEDYTNAAAWNTTGDVIVTGQQLNFSTDISYFYQLVNRSVKAGQTVKGKIKISGPAGSQIIFRVAPVVVELADAAMVIDLTPTPTIYELDLELLSDDTGFYIGLDVRDIPTVPGPGLPAVVVTVDWFGLTDDISVPYQRTGNTLVDPADYDSEGFNSYLVWSGAQAQVTPGVDFSGTNNITAFAGTTGKATAGSALMELGPNAGVVNGGGFFIAYPDQPNSIGYAISGQTLVRFLAGTGSFVPPSTMTIAAQFDLDPINIKATVGGVGDGIAADPNIDGPFGAVNKLNFGAREGLAAPYIGATTARIVRGAESTQAEIDGVSQYISALMGGTSYFTPNSYLTDQNGTVMVGPPPIVGYKGGLPYNAEQELVVQLNQPVSPGDSYVGGVRVGPLGGVYIIDTAPPPEGGYSNGFSNGFDVYDGSPIHTFSPADLFLNGEQGAWYDPSDLTTMFQDRAGTTPVTADGQTVGLILDKSGRGNHATAHSDAARPLYRTDGTYHWIQFDGVDDNFDTGVINKSTWSGGFGITGHLAASGDGGVFDGLNGAVSSNHEPFTDNKWYCGFGTATRSDAMGTLNYGSKYVTSRLRDATTSIYRINTSQVGSSVTATDFGGSSIIRIGSGTADAAGYYLAGNIYSLIIRGALYTPQQITDTETWVNSKTGAY